MATIPSSRYYVYMLVRPDGQPFYIGKGTGDRINHHEREARRGHNCHRCNVIRKIWKQGGSVQWYFMLETDDEQEAYDYEVELIRLYGRDTLTNKADGGLGGVAKTPETRQKLSVATKRYFKTHPHPNKGKTISAEQRQAIAIRQRENSWWKGKHHTIETREKMSIAQKGRVVTQESRAKMSTARAKPYPSFRHLESGEIIPAGCNLKALCRDRGLDLPHMWRVVTGNQSHHKGWVVHTIQGPQEPSR